MSDAKLTFYDLLGISPEATPDEVQSAYRALLVKVHPDISRLDNLDTHRLAAAVNEAWLTLKDPEKRAAYDESLKSPGVKPESPPLGYVMEELSDRGREYVAQLEKSRAHWDEERTRAAAAHEADRVAAEHTAAALARAREAAGRVRSAAPALTQTGEPGGIPWVIGVLIAAVTVALIAAGVLLLRPHSVPSAVATPQPGTTIAPAHVHKAATATAAPPAASPRAIVPAPANPTTSGATQHTSPTSKPALVSASAPPPKHAAAALPQRTTAPPRATAPPAHQAVACSGSRVISIGNGSLIATSDGSYRVDDPLAQQKTRTWSVGDAITICPGTSADGTPNAVLANGVRGTVQAVPVK